MQFRREPCPENALRLIDLPDNLRACISGPIGYTLPAMNQKWSPALLVGLLLAARLPGAQEAATPVRADQTPAGTPALPVEILVHADQVSHRLSPYLTGACIEDVNHEIYGGLYSQMLFGESFQEPAPPLPLKGFTAYGGGWLANEGALWAEAGDGPKLISNAPALAEGEVGVEVLLPASQAGNAGLIVKVSQPGIGADKFTGYEIALDSTGRLVLGRHRQNWEPIRTVPCEVPTNQWIPLIVRLTGNSLEVLVNGLSLITYEDQQHPLAEGQVGLRTWRRAARLRNLYVKTDSRTQTLPFEPDRTDSSGPVSGMWRAIHRGTATGEFQLETQQPFTGHQSQHLTFKDGQGEVGVENQGLNRWGLNFIKGRRYEGYVWLRAEQLASVCLTLESADGTKPYAETRVTTKPGPWQRLNFSLTPSASDKAGRFAIKLKQSGSVWIGHALLQPGAWGRFKGLPVRRDVAEGLVAQGLTVLRYGGSMINHPEYRWKNMTGPPDRRPPYHGTWYPYSSNGWGIFDFLNFCEKAGFLAIPALNMDETPQDLADFIDYANAPAKSDWGHRRAADGHPAPYGLKYLELGNEEAVNETYWLKFKALAQAIWARDTNVVLVIGDFAYDRAITDPYHFTGAPNITSLAAHKQILDLAREHGREVWFDVHIGTEHPPAPHGLPGVRSLIDQLAKLSPGARFKLAVFEFNANNHALKRALANACAINQLQRAGDRVAVACSANCLQPDRQNDNGWNQGLLFLNPSQIWPQPAYYVTQIVARNFQPLCLKTEVQSPPGALDVTATKSDDGQTLVLQAVNVTNDRLPARVTLAGFTPRQPAAHATVLTGDWEAVNTPEQPDRVKPTETDWHHDLQQTATYTFPPRSFTVLRFK